MDASLSSVEALQHLPHIVYALLHNPVLQAPAALLPSSTQRQQAAAAATEEEGPAHPDQPAAMRCLLRLLPPEELSVAVCPHLSSWAGPDQLAVGQHSLSSAALAVSPQPLWVLDTYWALIVLLRTSAGSSSVPFPPPADSLLRRTLAGIGQVRRCTPELVLLRQGVDDMALFDAWLIEDGGAAVAATAQPQQEPAASREAPAPAAAAAASAERLTFVSFLGIVARNALLLLRADAAQ